MHRVEKLADREIGFRPEGAPDFHSIIPLPEIISEILKVGVTSKKVNNAYFNLLSEIGSEFKILMETSLDDIEKAGSSILRQAVSMMREGKVNIAPGYDGEFGKISIFQ